MRDWMPLVDHRVLRTDLDNLALLCRYHHHHFVRRHDTLALRRGQTPPHDDGRAGPAQPRRHPRMDATPPHRPQPNPLVNARIHANRYTAAA